MISENEKEFILDLKSIRDYWCSAGKTKAETCDGLLFSILVYIDGDSWCGNGIRMYDTQTNKLINSPSNELHDLYYQVGKDADENCNKVDLINGMSLPRFMAANMLSDSSYKGEKYYKKEDELTNKLAAALKAAGITYKEEN